MEGTPSRKKFPRLRRWARHLILKALWSVGEDFQSVALDASLERCKQRPNPIATVIDIGASDGRWTEICLRHFPQAFYYLIEAQAPHREELEQLKRRLAGRLDFTIAAAADQPGEVFFDASDLQGGIAAYQPFERNCITVPSTTVDIEVARAGLKAPFLLKLDTHGFEVPILAGARKSLRDTGLIIIETYNFNFSPQNLRFQEMVAHLEGLGFRCVDICDPLFRRRDHALWQFDLIFEPVESPTFRSNEF